MALKQNERGKKRRMKEAADSGFSEICKSIYSKVISFFILCVLVVFPLYYRDYYYDILESKYQFYYLSIVGMIAAVVLLTIIFFVVDRLEFKGNHTREFFRKFGKDQIKSTITCSDCFLLAFLVIAIISTLQSDFVFEAFWGNEGRFTGLFLHILYILSFFIVSRLYRFQRWHIQAFIIVAMLPLLFGITDYFNMDLLHFKKDISADDWKNFTSTFGNINTYTTYVGVIFGCVSALFAAERVWWKALLYYGALVITTFAMIMGISDNGFLAMGIVFAALPFYALQSREGTRRYVTILATFLSALAVMAWINTSMKGHVLALEGVFLVLTRIPGLKLLAAAAWAAAIILYLTDGENHLSRKFAGKSRHSKGSQKDALGWKYVKLWGGVMVICFLAVLFLLFDANLGGNAERYGSLGQYLKFSDEWGTYRGMIWRITMESYGKQPLHHKIFGYGLDTFGMMILDYRGETTRICGQVFDSVHNEYLQYFVTVGPLGFLAYIGFLTTALNRIVKQASDLKYALAILFGVLCYLIQGIVTINLPIVTPIMWMLLSVGTAAVRQRETGV